MMERDRKSVAIRIGVLGAARITPMALIQPARKVLGVKVCAIAARDLSRAQKFATQHSIPHVHATYEALLDDPEIDAIYNPLPNSLHCEWTIRALRAGKHVLCEKPLAANANQAMEMGRAAEETGLILCEAFHYRYHPLAARMKAIVDSGEMGAIQHVEAHLNTTVLNPNDIRFSFDLAGGALMDTGAYTVNLVRFLGGAEPEVVRAKARCIAPQVDRWMEADFRFADGRIGRITCSLLSRIVLRWLVVVAGDRGMMRVVNPIRPHRGHSLTVTINGTKREEQVPGDTTFTHQLMAFAQAVRGLGPNQTDATDAIANLCVIDAIYEKAGLRRRGT